MFSSNATQVSAVTQAEAIDFDGTNDYMSRASLVGNSDGKQFTCSAFFYIDPEVNDYKTVISVNFRVQFRIKLDGGWYFTCKNAANVNVLDVYRSGVETYLPVRTWVHFLISIDLTDSAKRSIYVNDILMTGQIWGAYTNDNIAWTSSTFFVGANNSAFADPMDGRLSNVFLDYTYRDLSITANRRLFVTADLKPAAGQAALNPILYLPMGDPTQPGLNAGTGGNFTLTGTVARSGRGPNQYNAPYSDLDGSTDYLSKATNLTGIANSKLITLQFCMNLDTVSSGYLLYFDDNGGASSPFRVYLETNGEITIDGFANTVTQCLKVRTVGTSFVAGRNYVITVSVDMSSTSRRFFYVNGSAISPTWTTYSNLAIVLTYASPELGIGANGAGSTKVNGRLGAWWFNTSYIDLSVASNLAKFVSGTGINAKPVDLGATGELPTGTAPLIYLPMYGNNAGKNYGTGGDFTVNSGLYTGARGPNEFWGNKADFNGTTGYLSRTSALSGLSDSKTISGCLWFNADNVSNDPTLFEINTGAGIQKLFLTLDSATTGRFRVYATNASNTAILNLSASTTLATVGTTFCVLFCFDLTNTTLRRIYINDVNQTLNVSVYTNDLMDLTTSRYDIGAAWDGATAGTFFDGRLSEFYFTTEYIDFSQEANRLKFRDCFGNPTDLPSAITAGTVPNPAIYMRFPPTSFGTNSGTGGDFTVNGTITDGGQL